MQRYDARIARAISEIVRKQIDTGIDIVDDGEHSKVNWMAYARARPRGLEEIDSPVRFRGPTRDSLAFPGAYEDMRVMLAGRSGAIVPKRKVAAQAQVCSGPIAYVGQQELQADIDNLKAALKDEWRRGRLHDRDLAVEPRALLREPITTQPTRNIWRRSATPCTSNTRRSSMPGCLLQIDDPRMATHYNRAVDVSIEDCRKFIALRVEAVNHALRGIPADRVRFHTCYSVNVAPRVYDFELKHFVDLMLKINACAYLDRGRQPAPRA